MKLNDHIAPITLALAGIALVGIVLVMISWAAPVLTPIMLGWYLTALSLPGYFWLQKRGVKPAIALLILILAIFIGGVVIGLLAIASVNSLQEGLHVYLDNLDAVAANLQVAAGEAGANTNISEMLGSAGLGNLLVKLLPMIIDAIGNFFFALVLVAFFLIEAPRFQRLLQND